MNPIIENKMNVIIFLTDQERATQHFPEGWEANLPGLTQLKKNGLTFNNNFTNSCMCSPARSTFMTGQFPAQHGVKSTLELNMPKDEYPDQVVLNTEFKNIATVMSEAGYNVVYKGKWHCSKPANDPNDEWTQKDLEDYGFSRWNPKDAGADQSLNEAGGPGNIVSSPFPEYENDSRFMYDDEGETKEGVLAYINYLKSDEAKQDGKPFCLIISLVNPHDVLFLGNETFGDAGYKPKWTLGDIELPATYEEDDLSTKPTVQTRFLNMAMGLGVLKPERKKIEYINFYGNLIKSSDAYLKEVLDALGEDLLNETLIIRTSDHGEMGLAHGGMRQKNFNFYEEAIRIPLIYSNPTLFSGPQTTDELVSHVDFLPTLAGLVDVSPEEEWKGIDYSQLIIAPEEKFEGQSDIIFTYDDWQSGQKNAPYPGQPMDINGNTIAPNHIVGIREKRFKLAEYYDDGNFTTGDDRVSSEYEMYDLEKDPNEIYNLTNPKDLASLCNNDQIQMKAYQKVYDRLMAKLEEVKESLGINSDA